MIQLKTAALGAVLLALAAGPAFAQGDAMAKDHKSDGHMSNDHMAKHAMAKDGKMDCKPMAKGAMADDHMASGAMAKDGMGDCKTAKPKTGAMSTGGMMKDDGKAAKH